jgi:MOSC domain-containing protein YiiM
MSGRVIAIYTAGSAGEPMQARTSARAVPGRGLEGDRYFSGAGAYSGPAVPGREVTELTLIEEEVIGHLQHDLGLSVSAPDSRRNIVTHSLALNELVGTDFWVGPVLLRGAGLCEPCVSLVRSPANKHLLRGLVHKGGLRAQILTEGVITIGDAAGALAARRLAAVG